jgi:hypothetical protein
VVHMNSHSCECTPTRAVHVTAIAQTLR